MPRRQAAPLPKVLELIQREIIVARQIQQAIEQHRTVSGRQNKAIPIRPLRVFWVVPHHFCPQHIGSSGHSHRHAGVTGVGFLHAIHSERADRID